MPTNAPAASFATLVFYSAPGIRRQHTCLERVDGLARRVQQEHDALVLHHAVAGVQHALQQLLVVRLLAHVAGLFRQAGDLGEQEEPARRGATAGNQSVGVSVAAQVYEGCVGWGGAGKGRSRLALGCCTIKRVQMAAGWAEGKPGGLRRSASSNLRRAGHAAYAQLTDCHKVWREQSSERTFAPPTCAS